MPAIALPLAARRISWLYRLITGGQPRARPGRNVTRRTAGAVKSQVVEGVPRAHPHVAAEGGRGGPLVHGSGLPHPVRDARQRVFPAGPADYRLPVIGHFPPFEWLVEVFAWGGLLGIVVLRGHPQKNHPRRGCGRRARASRARTFWQAYYVEATIFFVTVCILLLRGLEAAIGKRLEPDGVSRLALPAQRVDGRLLVESMSLPTLATWVYVVATVKILISFAWMITIVAAADDGRSLAPLPAPSPTSGSSASRPGAPSARPSR